MSHRDAASIDALIPFGWSDRVAALLPDSSDPARVTRVDRGRCLVVAAAGPSVARTDIPVTVGDWVSLTPTGHEALPWRVDEVASRWSVVERVDPRSEGRSADSGQVLAANVDVVASVHPLDRALSPSRIERELALAWEAGATPVVVLTKADRHGDVAAAVADLKCRLLGVDVLATSVLDGSGLDAVAALLRPNRTLMLFGASGAGKSTLANALLGEELLETGGVRRLDARGRHTTTARHLLAVPGGGVLLDTPGLRSIGLHGAAEGVARVFADIEELAAQCRFGDCGHLTEPGCAVLAALEHGDLDGGRLKSWRKLQRELLADRRKVDPAAAAARTAEVKRWGRAMKQFKQSGRNRP